MIVGGSPLGYWGTVARDDRSRFVWLTFQLIDPSLVLFLI